ncbi:cell surface protein [Methanosarcina siciliae T4/M]|uniref:Cell surface protein n=1 Tax=Methanosarcina siciliae T4/M TaxID=1434120 RepID=A0A0E3PAJ9_9EURY|nr:PKD domain-containing protein [Methanosarcina siciliae]AKB30309.1 cell surface protein [Methanosarcina siciliae T4/M]
MNKHTLKIFLICLTLLLVAAAQPVLGSDWAQFQRDAYNTGITADRAPITDPVNSTLSWEYKLGGNVDSAPIVAGDMMYAVAGNNHIYAFNRTTGGLVWEESTSGGLGFLIGNAAVGNGTVFVPTSNGKIFAFDAQTGSSKWNKTVSSYTYNQIDTPITYSDGKIYFGEAMGQSRNYFCLDENGNQVWSRPATTKVSSQGPYYWAGAAVIGDYLVYGDNDGHIVSVNKDTGTDIAEINVSEEFGVDCKEIRSSILYVEDPGRVYFTSTGGYCFALGFNPADPTFNTSDKHSVNIAYASTTTPAYYNGRIYIGSGEIMKSNGNGVYCLDADLTGVIWNYPVGGTGIVQSSPAISTYYDNGDGEVYIYFTVNAKPIGGVYCLKDLPDSTSPELVWSYIESGKTDFSLPGVAISDGWVYYGTDNKYIFGLTTPDSQVPEAPTADFSASPVSGDAPLTVSFTDLSTGDGITAWAWDFDNDENVDSTEQNPSYTYSNAGTYAVSLKVTGEGGSDSEVKADYITVSESSTPVEPVAAFAADVTSGTAPLTVNFTDQSTGSPTSWAWDFDNDGNDDSSEQSPSYTYNDTGSYTVKLTVSNENGSDALEISGMITVKEIVISEDTWYQFHKDAQHSGYSSSDAPDSANLAWIAGPLNDTYSLVPSSSVVIAEGMVFGLCNGAVDDYGNPLTSEGQLVAFDEETGEEIWNVTVMAPEWGSWSCPAYNDGKVFASAGKNTYCVNASTGDILWTFQNPSELASCNGGPAIGDGKVFASDWDGGNYYCLDENTGELLWTFKVDGLYAQSTPAYKEDRVYLSGWTTVNAVYCVNATTGELIWENDELSSNPCGSITVTDEGLYLSIYSFGTEDGFYKLDLNDGHEIWGRPDIPPTDSTPAVVNGKVYLSAGTAGYSDLNTYCLNASDGKTIWVTDSSENIGDWVCSPAVADGKVFTGGAAEGLFTGSSTLYAFDAETGTVIWSYKGCGGSPAIADDMVFSTGSGKLYAFKEAEVSLPEANFSSNVSSGKAPLTVGFTDESTGEGITDWAWDFENDGNVDSTEQNPVHTYTADGNYTVNLTVTSAAGSDSEVKDAYIVVSESLPESPVANFTATPTSGNAPLTVNFTDASTGTVSSYAWDFDNDGNVDSTEQSPSYIYAAVGTYTVNLTVTGTGGSDSEVKVDLVEVSKSLVNSYSTSMNNTNPGAPDPAIPGFVGPDGDGKCLNNGPNNVVNPVFLEWASVAVDYSPANQSINPNFADPAKALGPVTGSNMDIVSLGDLEESQLLAGEQPGSVTFGFDVPIANGDGPDLALFENGFMSGSGIFAELAFVEVSTDNITFVRFPAASLTPGLVGGYGTIDPTNVTNLVGKHVNAYGNSWGTPFDLSCLENTTEVLNGSVDLNNINYVRVVDIPGNGFFKDSLGNPIYDAWVTWGSGGLDLEAVGVINTAYLPVSVAEFSVNVTSGYAPLTVQFTDQSTYSPTSWAWDFDNDGSIDNTEQNPSFTYTTSGNYSVNLTVTNAAGSDSEVKDAYIVVSEPLPEAPVANFTATPTSGNAPLTVNFTDASTGTISSYAWDFDNDGSIDSTEQNPSHTYTSAGNYTVNLTVENAAGTDFELKTDYIEVSEASGSTVTLYFDPENSSVSENESTEINLVASNFPAGLSGYNLTVALDDPTVAEIVDIEYPSWALITENSSLPATSIYLKAVDGEDAVKEGAAGVVLATLKVSGKESGSANLSIGVDRLDDDSGDTVEPAFLTGKIEVTLLSPLPDQEYAPRDLDGDGLYEDLTGNGEFSFVDVVAYFHNMDWIEENMPVEYFDFNGNGRIDFDDVVDMFAMI